MLRQIYRLQNYLHLVWQVLTSWNLALTCHISSQMWITLLSIRQDRQRQMHWLWSDPMYFYQQYAKLTIRWERGWDRQDLVYISSFPPRLWRHCLLHQRGSICPLYLPQLSSDSLRSRVDAERRPLTNNRCTLPVYPTSMSHIGPFTL